MKVFFVKTKLFSPEAYISVIKVKKKVQQNTHLLPQNDIYINDLTVKKFNETHFK